MTTAADVLLVAGQMLDDLRGKLPAPSTTARQCEGDIAEGLGQIERAFRRYDYEISRQIAQANRKAAAEKAAAEAAEAERAEAEKRKHAATLLTEARRQKEVTEAKAYFGDKKGSK